MRGMPIWMGEKLAGVAPLVYFLRTSWHGSMPGQSGCVSSDFLLVWVSMFECVEWFSTANQSWSLPKIEQEYTDAREWLGGHGQPVIYIHG